MKLAYLIEEQVDLYLVEFVEVVDVIEVVGSFVVETVSG
jgi:hypothetical protein